MTLHSYLSHHYSHGSSSLQFSISSTDGLLDEESIRTAYDMVCSILIATTLAHANNKCTHRTKTYRDERVPLDTPCPETIRQTIHENGIPRMELV